MYTWCNGSVTDLIRRLSNPLAYPHALVLHLHLEFEGNLQTQWLCTEVKRLVGRRAVGGGEVGHGDSGGGEVCHPTMEVVQPGVEDELRRKKKKLRRRRSGREVRSCHWGCFLERGGHQRRQRPRRICDGLLR